MVKRVFIATPMYGGLCSGQYTNSMIELGIILAENKIAWRYQFLYGESLITRARNYLTKLFLLTDCTHLLFIDADIKFNPIDVVSFLEQDKDILCGIYPKKTLNWHAIEHAVKTGVDPLNLSRAGSELVVNLPDNVNTLEVDTNKPFEVENSGTGFMMIKREVFLSLENKVPYYLQNPENDNKQSLIKGGEVIKEYFATSIDDNKELLSEDYHFCKLAKQEGFKIHAAPWVNLSHMGSYEYRGGFN